MLTRTAVCVAGEFRSMSCRDRGSWMTPAESQRRHVLAKLGPHDVFVVLDAAANATAALRPLLRNALAELAPVGVHFDDVPAEGETEEQVSRAMHALTGAPPLGCAEDAESERLRAPGNFHQAHKLRSCWRMLMAHERTRLTSGSAYSHVLRLRPDFVFLVPFDLHKWMAGASPSQVSPSQAPRAIEGRALAQTEDDPGSPQQEHSHQHQHQHQHHSHRHRIPSRAPLSSSLAAAATSGQSRSPALRAEQHSAEQHSAGQSAGQSAGHAHLEACIHVGRQCFGRCETPSRAPDLLTLQPWARGGESARQATERAVLNDNFYFATRRVARLLFDHLTVLLAADDDDASALADATGPRPQGVAARMGARCHISPQRGGAGGSTRLRVALPPLLVPCDAASRSYCSAEAYRVGPHECLLTRSLSQLQPAAPPTSPSSFAARSPTLVRFVPFGRRTSNAGAVQRRFAMLRTSEAAECAEAVRAYACGERVSRVANGSIDGCTHTPPPTR